MQLTMFILVLPLLFSCASALSTPASNMASMSIQDFFAEKQTPTIVTICGSQREGSFNKMLHDAGCAKLEEHGVIVKTIDLDALDLPLYNPNKEEDNFPESANTLKSTLVAADGIFVTCPEYNGFITPLLLNAITWATRGEGDMYAGFKGKVVSCMATSPGPVGGLRMLRTFQGFLQDMGALVTPGHNTVGSAFKVFDSDGTVTDEKTQSKIDAAIYQLVHFSRYEANRERDCAIFREVQKLKTLGEYGQVDP